MELVVSYKYILLCPRQTQGVICGLGSQEGDATIETVVVQGGLY